jgi:inward rectifier potassium channel
MTIETSEFETRVPAVSPQAAGLAEESRDLGFGSVVARVSNRRLLNRDGTFNVRRRGLGILSSLSAYHALLTMSWPHFLVTVIAFYIVTNAFFATIYWALGPTALSSPPDMGLGTGFIRAFFFSVQTEGTIGYGHVYPMGVATNLVVTVESVVGLLTFALITGLLFARFSRPTARLVFSDTAVIAPYRGITAFEFRIVNSRSNELIDVEARVVLNRYEMVDGRRVRRFYPLALERTMVTFMPLSWTIVHPIDPTSPLFGVTREEFIASDPEFLILLSGIDETFSQTVHARSSYNAKETVWGAKFGDIYDPMDDREIVTIDITRVHRVVDTDLPAATNGATATR